MKHVLSLVLAILAIQPVIAQESLPKHSFDTDAGAWMAGGANANAKVDSAVFKEGKGSLKYEYVIGKGELSFLAFQGGAGSLKGAKSVQFWARSSDGGNFIFNMQEKDAGRYQTALHLPKDQWQKVEIDLADLTLAADANDPKDPNNKLDADQVEVISLADFGNFLAQADNADLTRLLNIQTGKRTLNVDEFAVRTEPAAVTFSLKDGEAQLDTFASPQADMFTLGKASIAFVQGAPTGAKAAMITYRQSPMSIMGSGKGIPLGSLAGMKRLTMKAASTKPMQFFIQLEEVGGGKWNGVIELPGGSQAQDINLKFEDFSEADDSKDANKKLDLDQVKQFVFIDLTGLVAGVDQENTLWISSFKTVNK